MGCKKNVKTPAGACKLVLIAVGIVLLGLSAGSFPNDRYRGFLRACSYTVINLPRCDATSGLHKEYMFFAMTIISLVWVLGSFVLTLAWKPEFRAFDSCLHVLIGILLLIGSILVLQSVNYRYGLSKDCSPAEATSALENGKVAGWCGVEHGKDLCGASQCWLRHTLKFDLTVAAGAIGLIQSVLFFVAAAFVFNTRNSTRK